MGASAIDGNNASYWEMISQAKQAKKNDKIGKKLLNTLDADNDGSINLEESGLSQEKYTALDTDKNSSVSLPELADAIQLQRSAMHTRMKLSDGEEQGKPDAKDVLSAVMTNAADSSRHHGKGHGVGLGNKGFATNLFKDLDGDGDGSLTLAETGLSQSAYEAMDASEDGALSSEEFVTALQQQKEFMQNRTADAGSKKVAGAQSFLAMLANRAYQANPPVEPVTEEPETNTEDPTGGTEQPVVDSEQPVEEVEQPVAEGEQSTDGTEEEPTAENSQQDLEAAA